MGHDLHNLGNPGNGAGLSRSAGWAAIDELGDGGLEGRLVALAQKSHVDPQLFTQEVEEVSALFDSAMDCLQTWDDDAAQEVSRAALDYMIAVCRLVRSATGG